MVKIVTCGQRRINLEKLKHLHTCLVTSLKQKKSLESLIRPIQIERNDEHCLTVFSVRASKRALFIKIHFNNRLTQAMGWEFATVDSPSVDYKPSLFPLRDSRGKRTSKRARKPPAALKRDARVELAQPLWLSSVVSLSGSLH